MPEIRRHSVSRRAFLRGVGATVALPFMEQLAPAASAAGKPPLRLGIFTVAGGTVLESWRPTDSGPLTKLPSILRPLEFARDELLVLSGLSHHGRTEGGLNAHEHCALLHLTGAEVVQQGGWQARRVPVGRSGRGAGRGRPDLPAVAGIRPRRAREQLLLPRGRRSRAVTRPTRGWSSTACSAAASRWCRTGTRRAGTRPLPRPPAARATSLDRSIVDLVREEASDLRRSLGNGDQRRLDQYLDAVRAIEKRIDFVEDRQRVEAMDAAQARPVAWSPTTCPRRLPDLGDDAAGDAPRPGAARGTTSA